MNIAFLGPTQWDLLQLVQKYPGCSTTELIFLASKEDVDIPEHRNSVLDTLALLREKSLIRSVRDRRCDPYIHYPTEAIQ